MKTIKINYKIEKCKCEKYYNSGAEIRKVTTLNDVNYDEKHYVNDKLMCFLEH